MRRQPFCQWLADRSTYSREGPGIVNRYTEGRDSDHLDGRVMQTPSGSIHKITSSLAMGMEFFLKGIPLMKPRLYKLGEIKRKYVVIVSDAKWNVLRKHPWLNKGLGGILWKDDSPPQAAALVRHTTKDCRRLTQKKDTGNTTRTHSSSGDSFPSWTHPARRGCNILHRQSEHMLCLGRRLQQVLGHPVTIDLLATHVPSHGLSRVD